MDLNKVKDILLPYLKEKELSFYSIEFVKEADALILRVCIDKDGGVDIDDLALCNEFLSDKIDSIDNDMPEYFLEVSSPGAEKELRNIDEIIKNIGSYVHVELENMIYEGNLLDVIDNDDIVIRFNAKGRFKTIHIPYDDIKFIRLAVKL